MLTQANDWIGSELSNGRYRIERLLGEGGMGSVFLGHDANLNDQVVVKIPQLYLLGNPEFTQRFALEVRSLVKLSHPHIVSIRDVGTHEGVPFAVMQFLGGGSLAERRRDAQGRVHPLPLHDVSRWLVPVAEALDFVHKQGFLHRDIKPANLLFDEHGNIYVGDFGVAKALAAVQENESGETLTGGGFVGTAEYIAPEAVMGQEVTGAADQYSLGVTAYELLAGRRPFNGPNPSAVLVLQTTQAPPQLSQIRPNLPAEVCQAVHRALSKDPAHRFPNCMAFAKAFQAAANAKTQVPCPSCGSILKVKFTIHGKVIRCPACKERVVVEIPDQAHTDNPETIVAGEAKLVTDCNKPNGSMGHPGKGATMVQSGPQRLQSVGGQTLVQPPVAGGLAAVRSQKLNDSGSGQTLVASDTKRNTSRQRKSTKRKTTSFATVAVSLLGASITLVVLFCIAVIVLMDDPQRDVAEEKEEKAKVQVARLVPEPAVDVRDIGQAANAVFPTDPTEPTPVVDNAPAKSEPAPTETVSTPSPDDLESRFAKLDNAQNTKDELKTDAALPMVPGDMPHPSPPSPDDGDLGSSINEQERQRLTQEENLRRAKVQGAVLRRAPLPPVGLTVEPQDLIDIARGKDKPPYNPPERVMLRIPITNVRVDPLSGLARTETTYKRVESPSSKAAREYYKHQYYTRTLPNYMNQKMNMFEREATAKAQTKGIFRQEMLQDIQRLRTSFSLVQNGAAKKDVQQFCEQCAEFSVKYGDDSVIPPHYFDLAEVDSPAEDVDVDEKAEELLREAKNKRLLLKQWEFKDPAKALDYRLEAEKLEREAAELRSGKPSDGADDIPKADE